MEQKILFREVLSAAMERGADFAEIFFEDKSVTNLLYSNGKVENSVLGKDYGIGIRIIKGLNMVYAYTGDLSRENLIRVATDASKALRSGAKNAVLDFTTPSMSNYNRILKYPQDVKLREKLHIAREAHDIIKAHNDLIIQASARYLDEDQKIIIANTEGLFAQDRRVRTRLSVEAVAEYNGEIATGNNNPGASMGMEFFDTIDFRQKSKEAAETAVTMVKAPYAPSGKMAVIMNNAFGGVLFHEACGHGLEAEFVSRGSSVYCNKLGEKIASDVVNAVDDGTIPNAWGTSNIDDEGTPTQRNQLIKDGVLVSYLVDNLNGKRMGMKSTGSCRRESYRLAPTSRMNNTYIDRGESSLEDMISATEYGVFAAKLGGGSVDVVTGEFNFAVQEAYLIENGKLKHPIRGASLVGTGLEVLKKIDMVGNDLVLAEGMCGASSGTIPACVGQPPLRITELTVGGRE